MVSLWCSFGFPEGKNASHHQTQNHPVVSPGFEEGAEGAREVGQRFQNRQRGAGAGGVVLPCATKMGHGIVMGC